jgi:hypothetical protein
MDEEVSAIEITVVRSANGPLTKRISIAGGKMKSDGSACRMVAGTARRMPLDSPAALAKLLENMPSNKAIALGRLRPDLGYTVHVVLKKDLTGATSPNIIARTADYLSYAPNEPALMLLDHDAKAMPVEIAAKVEEAGGFWRALVAVIPVLGNAGRVRRRSTSAGLYNGSTRKWLANSASQHAYIAVQDGTDIDRALKTLHDRLWLAGYGYFVVGGAGQVLDRSIIDASVYGAERLVFEGAPILAPPVGQSQKARRPRFRNGEVVDTMAALPPLTITETARLRELKARQKQALAAKAAKVRAVYVAKRARQLAERTGITPQAAAQIIRRQCEGILLPAVVLPFDHPKLAGVTVAQVLANPARYQGETLADPLEGVGNGRCKAVIMRTGDGTPWIHRFAHGRTVYHLRYDAAAVRAVLRRTQDADVLSVLLRLEAQAVINEVELEELVHYVHKRTGRGVRVIKRTVQEARKRRRARRAQQQRERRLAERKDPRPQLSCPPSDAPWLPVTQAINEVIAAAPRPKQPRRDIDGTASRSRGSRSRTLTHSQEKTVRQSYRRPSNAQSCK